VQQTELTQESITPGTDFSDGDVPASAVPFNPEAGRPEGTGPRGTPDGNDSEGAWTGAGESDQPIVIHAGVEPPVLIQRVQPEYPGVARQARIEGVVVLRAIISRTGDVEVKEVLKALHPILDREAIRAVNQWKYNPARVGNRPVSVWFTVTVSYKLR
jgi:protein TonB